MIIKTNIHLYQYYHKQLEFFNTYDRVKNGLSKLEFSKDLPIKSKSWRTEYAIITNIPSFEMYLTDRGQLEFQVKNKSNKHYKSLHALLECSGLTPVKFNELVQKRVGEDYLAKIGDAYTITALLGLKYIGGEFTGLKNGFFYCEPIYGKGNADRYDFVDVNIDTGNHIT